jgi:hypothetical protein
MFLGKQEHNASDVININGSSAIPSTSILLRLSPVGNVWSAGSAELSRLWFTSS